MDMLAHLPKAWGQLKYLVVVFDCFTKRVEIQALAKITGENILRSPDTPKQRRTRIGYVSDTDPPLIFADMYL
ncbi:hypothetical protein MTR_5g066220 [Medicago truncatula]|uniref:Uncharacterized protein n=1 Tax=Medicago truncatula TaxID=3880 RepID=G7KBL5_MEDTR|nr:hypothetical protein MTR_5g066220 [Medicago truncatula]